MGRKALNFFHRLASNQYKEDAKVVVMLVMAAHFIITSFLVSFFAFYLVLYTPKGMVNKELIDLLKGILEQDFWIIISGFGFISTVDFGQAMIQRAVAKASGPADVVVQNAENVVTPAVTTAATVNTDNIETVNTNTTNVSGVTNGGDDISQKKA